MKNRTINPENQIRELAKTYALKLDKKINDRMEEMKNDDISHHLIYQVLGITNKEGILIDLYQNKGRFLYRYAGSFLEEATIFCILHKYPNAEQKVKILNSMGQRPKRFEIDCLVDNRAIEIKWRDATTDGDHITKEHTRAKVIKETGYKPIRVMFYYPNRKQAMRIQDTLKTIYIGLGGEYYSGNDAWRFILDFTGINLKEILETIAKETLKNQG